MNFYIFLT